jgi:DNA-binding CsgD family transcriptional regulator
VSGATIAANLTQRLAARLAEAIRPSIESLNRRMPQTLRFSLEHDRWKVAQSIAEIAREFSARVPSEISEGAAAVAAYREGNEDPLWRWAEDLIDRKPDPFMRVKLGSDVTKLGDGLTVQYTFALIKAHRLRLEESTRTRQGARVSTQVFESMSKSSKRDYMQALRSYEQPPNETLREMILGAVFSLDANMPLDDLRPKVQKIIRDDNRLLAQTRKPDEDTDGAKRAKIGSVDKLAEAGKEFEDLRDLAAFAQMEEERRALTRLGEIGLTPREWELAQLQLAGFHPEEIADKLNISRSTVDVHIHNIYKKLSA